VTRRRAFLVAALLLLGWGLLQLPELSRRLLASALGAFFQRPAYVGALRFHVLPLEAEILAIRVDGPQPDAPAFLEVARVSVTPSLLPLFGRRVVLSRLALERPVLRVNAWAAGGDDLPKLGGGGEGLDFRIRRLSIEGGALFLNHQRVPLEADVRDLEGHFRAKRGGVLQGNLSLKPGRVRFGSAPELPVTTDLELELDGALVTVKDAHVRAEGSDLAYHGTLDLRGQPEARLSVNGKLDLGVLDRHVLQSGFAMQGSAHYEGTVAMVLDQVKLKGRLTGVAGSFRGVAVRRFEVELERDERGVRLHQLEVSTLGGAARLEIEVPRESGPARLQAELKDVDAEGALTALFACGALGLDAGASGSVELSWPPGRRDELSGRMRLALASHAGDSRTPLDGRLEWRAEQGVQLVERAEFRTPRGGLRLAGRIDADQRVALELDGESSDLAESDDLARRVRRALGAPAAQLVGVSGSGIFHGRLKGSLAEPLVEGRFSGKEIGYLGVEWGSAEWAGSADADEIHAHSLVLRRPGGELWLDGSIGTGAAGAKDALEARVRFADWPAADFVKALALDVELSGLLSGDATLTGRRGAPLGELHVTARNGRYRGVAFAALDVAAALRGSLSEAKSGSALVGGGRVTFHGTLAEGGVYDGALTAQDVSLDELLPPLDPGVTLGGRVSGELSLSGTLERPRLSGHFASERLFLGDEGIGALDLTLAGAGDGDVTLAARCSSPRVSLSLDGRVGAAAPHEAELRIAARETSFDPFARLFAPALPAAVGIVASGDLRLAGPLTAPDQLAAEALVSSLLVALPDYPVQNREPLLIRLQDGRALLGEVRLAAEGTNLLLSGSAGLGADAPLALQAEGDADLQALAGVTRRLHGRGAARLTVSVSGTRAAPRVEGTLEIEGAGVRVRGLPQGIDSVQGAVRFSESAAHFEGVTGKLGGGDVELSGQAAYGEGRLRSFEVRGAGRSLLLRYPEGLRSLVDADLRLYGDVGAQWLTGAIDVKEARWTRRYDVASEILATRAPRQAEAARESPLRYDVRIRAPGTLAIDNNLATLAARADLVLQGSYDAPALLGRAEIDRGRVYFQGTTYVIRRGTIDFSNPQEIDPLFNIEAEARVRSYRVTLKMNGTLERVYPTLVSDPPLSAVQILSLLAGADESAVASLAQSQADQARLAATGAATLAAGRLSEQVGLERGAEKLLGLSRFSIDPSVVRGGVTDPTARLTAGKRVTPDLNVLYSVDLRGTDERLLSLEYTLSDRLSVLLTRTEPGGFGFDVRLRHSR
jgi:autotransporter translocation and assembly factor TamB